MLNIYIYILDATAGAKAPTFALNNNKIHYNKITTVKYTIIKYTIINNVIKQNMEALAAADKRVGVGLPASTNAFGTPCFAR